MNQNGQKMRRRPVLRSGPEWASYGAFSDPYISWTKRRGMGGAKEARKGEGNWRAGRKEREEKGREW